MGHGVFPVAASGEYRLDYPMTQPPLNIPALLRSHGLRPDKRLGQNFLIDDSALQKVVAAGQISPQDTILEIGAGIGNLTRYLAAEARQVVAVELDEDLIPVLRSVLESYPNIRILAGDILNLDPADIFSGDLLVENYLVVANIPYYITSAVIRHLLEARLPPQRIILTVQREVAERICAAPGALSLLALSVQVYGAPEIAGRIPSGAFYPPPKVDSAIVRVTRYPEPRLPAEKLGAFFTLARAGFSQKRKTLRNALAGGLGISGEAAFTLLQAAGIDPRRRAETLDLSEWAALVAAWEK